MWTKKKKQSKTEAIKESFCVPFYVAYVGSDETAAAAPRWARAQW